MATWVNTAFSSVFAPVLDIISQEFRRVMEVSYLGYVHGTQAAPRLMRARDRGTIVQVGSTLAYRGTLVANAMGPGCRTGTWLAPATASSSRRTRSLSECR